MAQIFLSHHGGDRATVERLYRQLERDGYGPDQVFVDWDAADETGNLSDNIKQAISSSALVIFCVSDAALTSEWFKAERTAAYLTGGDHGGVFVKVGQLAPDADFRGPFFRAAQDYPLIDLSTADGRAHERLLETISKRLSLPPPIVVHGALVAFGAQQFQAFAPVAAEPWTALKAICRTVGMLVDDEQELRVQLAKRYGPTADDFAPFGVEGDASKPLKSLIGEALIRANAYRAGLGQPRIHLRWMHQDLLSGVASDRQKAQAAWNSGYSIALVDAITMLDPRVTHRLDALLSPPDRARSAVVWVPPHTRHLAGMAQERLIGAGASDRLALWFEGLGGQLNRSFAFDIADPTELQQWVHRLLSSVVAKPEEPGPSLNRISSMSQGNPPEVPTLPRMTPQP